MAPRAPDSLDRVIARLRRAAEEGRSQVAFQARGMSHITHVVVIEAGRVCLRRWVLDPQKAEAFQAAEGRFMPEDAEALSEPGPDVLLEAGTLEAFIVALTAADLI